MNSKREGPCKIFFGKIYNKIRYFGDNSNLHGVKYAFSTANVPTSKRLFWLAILVCCSLGAAAILQASLKLYSTGAVSYTVETNYLDWNTPFPAVTICEQFDSDRFERYISRNKIPRRLSNFYKDVAFWNVKYCKTCSSCTLNKTCVEDFQEFIDNYRLKCPELLAKCSWNDQPFSCCDKFHPIQTEYGTCFVFNSRLVANGSIFTVNLKVGLPKLLFHVVETVAIRVDAPDDRVSVVLSNILKQYTMLAIVTDFDAYLKAEETVSDTSILTLSKDLRDCLLKNERPSFAKYWPYEEYTNSACLMYCRAVAQVDACNCTHHFLPKLESIPVCDIKGLSCLYSNREMMKTVSDCGCPLACEEMQYKVVHVFFNRQSTPLSQEMLARGSRVKVQLSQIPALRVKRQAIRELLGLVVDIGGVGGVFFGASLLSVIEIIYLLCFRR